MVRGTRLFKYSNINSRGCVPTGSTPESQTSEPPKVAPRTDKKTCYRYLTERPSAYNMEHWRGFPRIMMLEYLRSPRFHTFDRDLHLYQGTYVGR